MVRKVRSNPVIGVNYFMKSIIWLFMSNYMSARHEKKLAVVRKKN
jgi:hypothetical protein